MANIPLKTIKFPGLDDTYTVPQVDDDLDTAGAAADAKATGDALTEINERLGNMDTATSEDVGRALKVKTVTNGQVSEWEFDNVGVVDSALSGTSTNPVQNKVIASELGMDLSYSIPTTYHDASYSNAAGTLKFLYDSDSGELIIREANEAGEITQGEISTTNAGLAIGDGIGYEVNADHNHILTFTYYNTSADGIKQIVARFYNADYSYNNGVEIPIPNGEGVLNIDLIKLAEDNNVNLSLYPNFMIRSLGWDAHTATVAEDTVLNIKGYAIADNALKYRVSKNEEDIELLNGNIGNLSELDTEVKTDLVSAVNEVMQSGGSVTVDPELSGTSTNPVQNKVITSELGMDFTYSIPTTYHSASYSSSTGTLKFLYDAQTNELIIRKANDAGEITTGEISTTNAGLTIGDGIGYAVNKEHNCILTFAYYNTSADGIKEIVARFYNSDYSYNNGVVIPVPNGEGILDIDLVELAEENNVNLTLYPNFMIRSLGWKTHTATEAEDTTLNIKGYAIVDNALKYRITKNEKDIAKLGISIENVLSAMDDVEDTVDGFSDTLNACYTELGLDNGYVIPSVYHDANYSNAAGTLQFKYLSEDKTLYLRKSNGSSGEISTTNAKLTIGDGIGYPVSEQPDSLFKMDYVNTFSAGEAHLVCRFYNSDYSNNRDATIDVPVGTGTLILNLNDLAATKGVDLSVFNNFMIRALGVDVADSDEVNVTIYGCRTGLTLKEEVTANKVNISSIEGDITEIQGDVEENTSGINALDVRTKPRSSIAGNMFAYKPWCAHLFLNTVSDTQENTYVPSQSLYDIEISKRLGFYVIEANTHRTSDGGFVCFHGSSGTFGPEFVAAPGSSYSDAQIQATDCSTVTLDWIRTNVVYKAKYQKLRVSPPTLEEFLYACKKNVMLPMINYVHVDEIAIADGVMGKDNYILYSAPKSARAYSNAPFLTITRFATKQEVVDWIEDIGTPCIWSALHPEDHTKSEWAEIVKAVHEAGALINFAGGYIPPTQTQEWLDIGFDFGSSGWDLNPVISGNMANLTGDETFVDFTTTGTISNGVIEIDANETVVPASPLNASYLCGSWLDVTFTGTISVSMGRWITHGGASEFTADEPKTIHLSTYWINATPTFEVKSLADGTKIESIVFKASKM